jgi:hypothetical protein
MFMTTAFKRFACRSRYTAGGADEPDIDNAIGIIDPHYDAILIARDVEDSAAVVENARTADGSLHVRLLTACGAFRIRD